MPFKWYPAEKILDMMAVARLLDLTEVNGERVDKLVTLLVRGSDHAFRLG